MRVFCTMRSQKTAGPIRRMITKGVKLMVAENSISPVTADHRAGDLQHLANCRAAVDEIADKNRIATFSDVATVSLFVAESSKQSSSLFCVTVNIPNYVVGHTKISTLFYRKPLSPITTA